MKLLNSIQNTWYAKLMLSFIVALFAPFQIGLIVLLTLIILDTITGTIYAISIKKFNSTGLKRGLKKLFIYFCCILIVRLTEIGLESFIRTIYLTNLIISYLILIESTSALENLTLLGIVLPKKIKDLILSQISTNEFKGLLQEESLKKEYIQEILQMIDYHFPAINDYKIKNLLHIMFDEWAQFINLVDIEFSKTSSDNTELLYYRIFSLIKATSARINENWLKENIPKDCIVRFNLWYEKRIVLWLSDIKDICFSDMAMDKKKTAVMEKVILSLYKTLTEIQRLELCKDGCKL
jgi:toxin secretion/phage lysis holin